MNYRVREYKLFGAPDGQKIQAKAVIEGVASLGLPPLRIVISRKLQNPPGFYVWMIESNLGVPVGFETSSRRKARELAA